MSSKLMDSRIINNIKYQTEVKIHHYKEKEENKKTQKKEVKTGLKMKNSHG